MGLHAVVPLGPSFPSNHPVSSSHIAEGGLERLPVLKANQKDVKGDFLIFAPPQNKLGYSHVESFNELVTFVWHILAILSKCLKMIDTQGVSTLQLL